MMVHPVRSSMAMRFTARCAFGAATATWCDAVVRRCAPTYLRLPARLPLVANSGNQASVARIGQAYIATGRRLHRSTSLRTPGLDCCSRSERQDAGKCQTICHVRLGYILAASSSSLLWQVFLLSIRAELENVESLSIPSTSHFCLDVKESAGSEEKKGVYVTSTEQHELAGSKGTANLVMKFAKGSKKEASVNVQEIKGVTRAYTADDDGKFVPMIAFECRGLDPTAFHPEGDWRVVSTGGTKFDNVDLKEGEWIDYCEKTAASVGIYNLESKFELYRGS